MNHHRSLFQRVTGFFSFVNIMWLLAILGITVSVRAVVVRYAMQRIRLTFHGMY